MAKKSRTAVLKRQREVKKAEKAAMKREKRVMREELSEPDGDSKVATADDLAGYGFAVDEAEATEEHEPPPADGARRPLRFLTDFPNQRAGHRG